MYVHMVGGRNSESVWYVPGLQEGLELVKSLDPYDNKAVQMTPCQLLLCSVYAVVYTHLFGSFTVLTAASGTPLKVPEGAQRVFMTTALFWNYPLLLPASGFGMCLRATCLYTVQTSCIYMYIV